MMAERKYATVVHPNKAQEKVALESKSRRRSRRSYEFLSVWLAKT